MIAILLVGYLLGLAAAVHRPTRRLGFGMLIGVTLTFPVAFVLTFAVGFAIWGGQ